MTYFVPNRWRREHNLYKKHNHTFDGPFPTGELEHAVNLSHPKLVFASLYSAQTILKVAKKTDNFPVVVFDGKVPAPIGTTIYSQFLNGIVSTQRQFKCQPQDIDQHVGLILYSSGTTGSPKGVQLTQANTVRTIHRQ